MINEIRRINLSLDQRAQYLMGKMTVHAHLRVKQYIESVQLSVSNLTKMEYGLR